MNKQRPVNIYLLSYKYPVTAIISVLHRISGVLVFLLIPLLLYLLATSLASPDQFDNVIDTLSNPFMKLIIWVSVSALLYHLVAGVRHLIMDLGWGEDLKSARTSAWAVAVIAAILTLLTGIWLW